MNNKNKFSRRGFLSLSTLAGIAGALGIPAIASCSGASKNGLAPLRRPSDYFTPNLDDKAVDGRPLKAGLIGCGGRGRGALNDFLSCGNGLSITALGDVFKDAIDTTNEILEKQHGFRVPAEMCFTGFDAYQKVIDSGVDMVFLCTPPAFRPEHFKYATDKGVHSFLEKPMAVDPEGVRSILVTGKQAISKGLCAIPGTMRRFDRSYVTSHRMIQDGWIGDIVGGSIYWNTKQLWYRTRQPGWSDMEAMLRDWVNWKFLSGDHIVEQHIHNIDLFTWMIGDKAPISALGYGSRQRRVTGDQYDNFSIDFVYENDVHVHSMSRQIDGTSLWSGDVIQGTKGVWIAKGTDHVIKDLKGKEIWKYDSAAEKAAHKTTSPYVIEHINLVNHIRKNEPIAYIEGACAATLAAIMGRESAYTGKTVKYEEMANASLNYVPKTFVMGPVDTSGPLFKVPVPGIVAVNRERIG